MMTESHSRKALGRGLAALIPGAGSPAPAGLRSLPIERIRPSHEQPRKRFDDAALDELAASIKERGLLQPIIVRKRGDDFELVAGERRWRAAARAGLQEVPGIVKELSESAALEVALIENVQRQDLDPLEEALAYQRLIEEHGHTQERVAQAVGKSRVAVTNALRLLGLPKPVLELVATGQLSAGHARALLTAGDAEVIVTLAKEAIARGLSVRELERDARIAKASGAKKPGNRKTPAEVAVEERLMKKLGTKVRLHNRKGKGRLEIFFHSLDQLDELIDKMS